MIPTTIVNNYDINNGGCGIAAILIAEKLKKNKFLWCDNLRETLSPVAPTHYWVVTDDEKAIDFHEEIHIKTAYAIYKTVKVVEREFVIESIKNKSSCNFFFNRKNSKMIADLIKVEIPEDLQGVL